MRVDLFILFHPVTFGHERSMTYIHVALGVHLLVDKMTIVFLHVAFGQMRSKINDGVIQRFAS